MPLEYTCPYAHNCQSCSTRMQMKPLGDPTPTHNGFITNYGQTIRLTKPMTYSDMFSKQNVYFL